MVVIVADCGDCCLRWQLLLKVAAVPCDGSWLSLLLLLITATVTITVVVIVADVCMHPVAGPLHCGYHVTC